MKRFLAPVLAFVCSLLLCGTALAADAAPPAIPTEGDVWDGTTEAPTTIVQKDGVSYYEITKCSQLAYLATVDEDSDWLKYSYLLANDLILNNVTLTWDKDGNLLTNTENLWEWAPIPTFSGTLNGNGHAISGLYTTIVDEGYEATGLFVYLNGRVCDLSLVNCHVQGITDRSNGCVGAISGDGGTLTNCSVSGVVKGACYVGGLCGYGGKISNCVNYASVYGHSYDVGGIAGFSPSNVAGCTNYGTIKGVENVGGIVGFGCTLKSQNFGSVFGEANVGGITGANSWRETSHSCNFGTVSGKSCVGGIAGNCKDDLGNCYNVGSVEGTEKVGGIVGSTMDRKCNLYQCYNIGTVTGMSDIGGVVGASGTVWGNGDVVECFYLANGSISGFGNGEDVENCVIEATAEELKNEDTFLMHRRTDCVWNDGWDFDVIWSISADQNAGYPYIRWQKSTLSDIPVTGVSLNKTELALGVGDAQYLTATVSPATAETTLSWKSSDTEVATVTKSGKVTALAPGSATVTVTTEDGGFSASCIVTVTAREQDEYRLGAIQPESMSGETLTAIPKGSFWACVPLTHLQESGNAVVMLATYDAAGRYLNALCARAEDLPKNSTVRLSLLVDNSGGEAAQMKAFVVPSLSEPMPIGAAAAR